MSEVGDAPPEFLDDESKNNDDESMFVSVMSPIDVNVQLDDEDDDENPFGEAEVKEKEVAVVEPTPVLVVETTPVELEEKEEELFQAETPPVVKEVVVPSSPIRSLESQVSTKSVLSEAVMSSQPTPKRSTVHDIEITVSDPTKVGDVSFGRLFRRATSVRRRKRLSWSRSVRAD